MHQLETYSNIEARGTVCFLWIKCFTNIEIYHETLTVYVSHPMSCPAIVKCYQQFEDGCINLTDAERGGRTATVSMADSGADYVGSRGLKPHKNNYRG